MGTQSQASGSHSWKALTHVFKHVNRPIDSKSSTQKHSHGEKGQEEGWLLTLRDQRGPRPTITKILIV